MTEQPSAPLTAGPSRRRFLAGTLAAAGVALLDPVRLAQARTRAAALAPGDLFPLGVASGDPTASGVVLWTRILTPDAADPLPGSDLPVDWEVATDDTFTDIAASGTAPAVAALAHSVHVEVEGLDADRWYWYRFTVDGRTSPVGRTRTFPGAGATPAQVRFGVATCQNWSDGYYTSHAAMAAEDLDFVLFVGDYIYERSKASGARPISLPESQDLPTYRARYELYKGDANLQAAHHRFPWILTVDDHEVANNVLGDAGQDGTAAGDAAAVTAFLARRADAFQVWYEHQPVRLPAPSGSSWQIYRTVPHSDLLSIFVLDGRQYRSPYPVGFESQGLDLPERFDPDRTMLGAAQERWLDGQLAATAARWNVLAQQTVMTAMPIPVGDATFLNFDQWDGYPAARDRLMHALVDNQVRNPIVLSGDIHLGATGAVRLDYEDPDAPDIAHEVVTTSISSGFNPTLLDLVQTGLDAAPWVRYANAHDRGYAVVTLTADAWVTDFRVMSTVAEPTATVSTDHTDRIADREPVRLPERPTDPDPDPAPSTTVPGSTPGTPQAPGATPVAGSPTYTG